MLNQLASLDAESAGTLSLDEAGRVVALYGKLVKLRDQLGGSLTYARRLLSAPCALYSPAGRMAVKSPKRAPAHWPVTAADDGAVLRLLRPSSTRSPPIRFALPLRQRGGKPHY